MPRSKFFLVLALLLLLSIPATAVLSDGHGVGEGYATVFDDAGMSDGLEVSLMGAEAPDAGQEYAVWLTNEDQSAFLLVGSLERRRRRQRESYVQQQFRRLRRGQPYCDVQQPRNFS